MSTCEGFNSPRPGRAATQPFAVACPKLEVSASQNSSLPAAIPNGRRLARSILWMGEKRDLYEAGKCRRNYYVGDRYADHGRGFSRPYFSICAPFVADGGFSSTEEYAEAPRHPQLESVRDIEANCEAVEASAKL